MDEGEGGDEERVGEIVVEAWDLLGLEEPLVDDRARGEAREVEAIGARRARDPHELLDALADHVELPLEGVLAVVGRAPDEQLGDRRQHRARERPRGALVDRHPPPAEEHLPLLGDHLFHHSPAGGLRLGLAGKEDHADAVAARCRKVDADPAALAAQELVGHLDEHPGAVAGQRIAAAGAPVGEVLQDGEGLLDDVAGARPLHVHHEPHPARIPLHPRILEPLRSHAFRLSVAARRARRCAVPACPAAAEPAAAPAAPARCAWTGRPASRCAPPPRWSGSG